MENIRLSSISFPDGSNQFSAPSSVITAVVASNGLSGGGSSGEVEFSISNEFGQVIVNLKSRIQALELAIATIQSRIQQMQSQIQQVMFQIGSP